MTNALLPRGAPADVTALEDPQAVVEAFLAALADADLDAAMALLDDDVLYVNVGLPAIRGREAVERAFRMLENPNGGFEVFLHAVMAQGSTVLTERTDAILVGRLRVQFWVWGRFEVHAGKITLWRDSFDFLDVLRGAVRAIAGLARPRLVPVPPTSPDTAPGR